jgi:hypothetical protein
MAQLEHIDDVLEVVVGGTGLDKLAHGCEWALDGLGDLVDILRLYDCVKVVLEDLGEVILQLIATEVYMALELMLIFT